MRLGSFEAAHRAAISSHPPVVAHVDDDITSIRRVLTLRPTSRGKIIGQDPQIRSVLDTIDRVARSSCTVLVTGESGTGKELVVAALHDASERRNAPLVTINCGAIPLELVESELFGHAKGAFTGAQNARRGHVATAEGGTLFLDEVGELPLSVQVKLLRVLQQREYTPVGESRAVKCDVRIVAATNRNLEAEVAAGRFREDLFYRLNVIHIHLPALRERASDVPVLADHFFRRFAESSGRDDLRGFSAEALRAIKAHPWQGNVRALENAVERCVLLARGPYVEAEDVLGRGAGKRVAVETPAVSPSPAAVARDPRREPEIVAPAPVVATRVTAHVPPYVASHMTPLATPQVVAPSPSPSPPSGGHPTVNLRAVSAAAVAQAMASKDAAPLSTSRLNLPPAAALAMPPAAMTPGNPEETGVVSVVPITAAGVRRGSDPSFPRVLPDKGVDLFSAMESYQNNLIRQALARTGGNKNRAAQLLGLNRTTLVEMIRRRGL